MLTAEELAGMRATTFENLPDTCRIVSPVTTRTAGGGLTNSPSVGPPIDCRVVPAGVGAGPASERVIVERIGSLVGWLVALPSGTPVIEADQIDITVDGITRRCEVAAVLGPRSAELERRLIATEVA